MVLYFQITYVDFAVFHALHAVESQFPEDYKTLPIPLLRAFKDRMASRQRIDAFLKSPRSIPFYNVTHTLNKKV